MNDFDFDDLDLEILSWPTLVFVLALLLIGYGFYCFYHEDEVPSHGAGEVYDAA